MVRLTASLNKEEFKKIKMSKQGLGLKTDQDCNWNPSGSNSSLGVRLEKFSIGKEGKK